MRLSGRTAVVTGAGRGIGEAIAVALAAEGCSVAACADGTLDLSNALRRSCARWSTSRSSISCDVADQPSVKALFEKVEASWGRLDILVNNAVSSNGINANRTRLITYTVPATGLRMAR